MNLDTQIITPRAFTLGGVIVILLLAYAGCAHAVECPRSCSEDRIEMYATITPQMIDTAVRLVQGERYVCPAMFEIGYDVQANGTQIWLTCTNGAQYTILIAGSARDTAASVRRIK